MALEIKLPKPLPTLGWLGFQFIGPFKDNMVKVFLGPAHGGHLIGEIKYSDRAEFLKDIENLNKKYFTK